MNNKTVLAGIVTFNPDIERFLENINAIYNQVDRLFVVDNGSSNIEEISFLTEQFSGLTIYEFGENRGIAAALNEIGEYAVSEKFDYFLTLDQDSVVLPNLISEYKKYLELPNLGLLNCYQKDRNLIGQPEALPENIESLIFVRTSGSLMPTDLFANGIKYDENLFIDKVDYDLNLLLAKSKYKIYQIPFYGLLHELGNMTPHKILGRKVYTFNYSPLRRYYIARNTIILMKKYGINKQSIRWFLIDIIDELKILFFENKKWQKTKGVAKGFWAGLAFKITEN